MDDCQYLVAGTGYTGMRVLDALPGARGLRRQATGDERLIEADFDRALPALPACDVLIYTVPPARDSDGDPRLERCLAALPQAPRRIVYFSTSGVYGDTGGRPVDETAALKPATARARRRQAAEEILLRYCNDHGSEHCILRVPGIYGPGRLGLERLQSGRAVLIETDARPGNRIHVDDLCQAALAAATNEHVPAVCNIGDGDYRSATAFARAVASVAGLPAPMELSMAEAEAQFSERRLSFLKESRRLDLGRMQRELRFTPRYANAEDGIRASLG